MSNSSKLPAYLNGFEQCGGFLFKFPLSQIHCFSARLVDLIEPPDTDQDSANHGWLRQVIDNKDLEDWSSERLLRDGDEHRAEELPGEVVGQLPAPAVLERREWGPRPDTVELPVDGAHGLALPAILEDALGPPVAFCLNP